MSVARGNKGFAGAITNSGDGSEETPRLPPRTGILAARENRLAALATGKLLTRVHELVDPARCRIWAAHNRLYEALDAGNCADLIDSLRVQGRQEVPAIVRRVSGDPAYEFEVICGARRHWSVTWLRAHDRPEFGFLVEPRELTDEEAFRVADLENRSRKDLSDYERASDYARAVDRYYDGNQQRMSDRLGVTKSWLSRYLELARLAPGIVAAFGDRAQIGISHAARLAPILRSARNQAAVLAEAGLIAAEQATRAEAGRGVIPAATVVSRLLATVTQTARRGDRREAIVRDRNGMILARGARTRGGPLTISISTPGTRNRPEVLEAVAKILDQIAGISDD